MITMRTARATVRPSSSRLGKAAEQDMSNTRYRAIEKRLQARKPVKRQNSRASLTMSYLPNIPFAFSTLAYKQSSTLVSSIKASSLLFNGNRTAIVGFWAASLTFLLCRRFVVSTVIVVLVHIHLASSRLINWCWLRLWRRRTMFLLWWSRHSR